MINKIKHWLGSFLHNSVAHPLMPFLPKNYANKFHNWTFKVWTNLSGLGHKGE